MGSDWIWELHVPVAGEAALREVFALAAERDLRPQRPDGLINLFSTPDAGLRTGTGPEAALAALATGEEHGQLWTNGDVDVFLSWQDGTLFWSLDAVHCHRHPEPGAGPFRELHARLTSLWLAAAERLHADIGRVCDEWSSEQAWQAGIDDAVPAAGWPAELGWWTYLGPGRDVGEPPLPEVAARSRRRPDGALLITLLDDPAAVDPNRYESLHTAWVKSLEG